MVFVSPVHGFSWTEQISTPPSCITIGSVGVSGIVEGNVSLAGVGSTGGGISGSSTLLPPPPLDGNASLIGLIGCGQVIGSVVVPIIAPVIGSIAIFITFPERLRLLVFGLVYPRVDCVAQVVFRLTH